MAEILTLCAVGDIFYDREDPKSMFAKSAAIFAQADTNFVNLEQVLSLHTQPASNARSPLRGHPRLARTLKEVGFDIASFANNHCLDFREEGLIDTINCVREQGIAIIGVGQDLDEARKPAIIDKKGTRVAFLAYNSILPSGYEARIGKPGCAPIRVWTSYQPYEGFQPGTPCRILTHAQEDDLEAMKEDIRKVRPLADVVIVSIHWGLHHVPAMLAMYQREVSHAAIDTGADLILGHHPHILKPIELYKGKVIFYSLGNFCTELGHTTVHKWSSTNPEMKASRDIYDLVLNDPAFPFHPDARKSMIAKISIANKKISKVSYLPVMINKNNEPEVLASQDPGFSAIVDYMRSIDKSQKITTKYTVSGDEVLISAPIIP